MAYFIFLKYLDSLEDFRKNPHVKIPPKSPCANFQSFDIFKNSILIRKEFFLHFQPNRSNGQPTHPTFWPSRVPHLFSFFPNRPAPPLPTGRQPLGRPSPPSRPNRPSSSSSRTRAKHANHHRRPASRRRPHGRPR
jgi:hypothetical protein